MMLVALGLVVFGVYGLCEARWRKVLAQRDYGPAREGNLAWLMLPPRCQEWTGRAELPPGRSGVR